ncbi:MAG: SurA N-terminal domain-containing protein [Deltaproteobacteria bacterium]|nr:SurA N-terminal domain-containing protein [Deltaproteobacteria bacterium]
MLDIIRRHSQSWAVKIIFALIIIVFVFWGANTMNMDSAQAVADVNGEPIYREALARAFDQEMQRLQRDNPDFPVLGVWEKEALAGQILRKMIIGAMLRQEAAKLGLGVSDIELSAHVSSMPPFQDASGRFSETAYRSALAAAGLTPARYEEMAGEELLLAKFQDYIAAAVNVGTAEARRMFDFETQRREVEYLPFVHANYLKGIKPSEAELISFYTENSGRWREPAKAEVEYLLFDLPFLAGLEAVGEDDALAYYKERQDAFISPAAYRTRHILIRLPLSLDTTEEELRQARQKAEKALAEIKAGAKFEAVARKYSEDELSRDKGGDLGWLEAGRADPAYEAALALLPGLGEAGKKSARLLDEPVRTYSGFHVIELLDYKGPSPRPFEEVREGILAQLREDAAYAAMPEVLAAAEDAAITGKSLEEFAGEYRGEVRRSGLLELAGIASLLDLTEGALNGLERMKAGDAFTAAIKADKGFVLLRLKEYAPSGVPDFEVLRPKALESFKAEEAAKLAGAAAAEALKSIREGGGKVPSALTGKILKAEASRFTGVINLGLAPPEFTQAIYLVKPGEWLDKPYALDERTVLVRVRAALPVAEKDWAQVGAAYTDGLNNLRKSEVFSLFLSRLQKQSKIELKQDYLLFRNNSN